MEYVMALLVGGLFAGGIYMMLRGELIRIVIGLVLLANAVNLVMFTMGRLTRGASPVIAAGESTLEMPFANPLPQALVLTAIVIGFGLLAFGIVLAFRTYEEFGTVNIERLRVAEPPFSDEEEWIEGPGDSLEMITGEQKPEDPSEENESPGSDYESFQPSGD